MLTLCLHISRDQTQALTTRQSQPWSQAPSAAYAAVSFNWDARCVGTSNRSTCVSRNMSARCVRQDSQSPVAWIVTWSLSIRIRGSVARHAARCMPMWKTCRCMWHDSVIMHWLGWLEWPHNTLNEDWMVIGTHKTEKMEIFLWWFNFPEIYFDRLVFLFDSAFLEICIWQIDDNYVIAQIIYYDMLTV